MVSDLAYFCATGVLVAVTPLFVTGPLEAGAAGVGVAMGSFSVTTLLLRPWAGRWSDRRGRRLLLVGGAALFAMGIVGHYLVTSLVMLVALRVLLGAAEALYFVAGFAALADLAPPGRTGEALSLNSLALFAGLSAGPLLGQGLLRWGGFPLAWAGAALLAALAVAAAVRVPKTVPSTGTDSRPGSLLQSAALLAFGVTVIALRLLFATLPDRVPPLRLAAAALGSAGAGLVLVGGIRTPAGLLAGTLVLGVGTAFLTPAIFAAVFSVVPAGERGSAAATTSIFIDLGLGGGPMVLGLAAAATSVSAAFLLAAALPIAGGALLLVMGRLGPARCA